jgi:hypothetical protein
LASHGILAFLYIASLCENFCALLFPIMRPTYGFYSWSVNLSRVRVRVRVTRDSQYVYDYLALLERGRLLSFIIFLIV